MAKHFGREDDLILLQVRPDEAASTWQPRHTYNLTSDRSVPFNTFAKAVVDTAASLGQAGDKAFFKNQAQTQGLPSYGDLFGATFRAREASLYQRIESAAALIEAGNHESAQADENPKDPAKYENSQKLFDYLSGKETPSDSPNWQIFKRRWLVSSRPLSGL